MSHDVFYNGVWINQIETKRFSQEVQYDESNTDYMYHRFRIRVAGSVHADATAALSTTFFGAVGSSATSTMATLHGILMHPRGEFVYRVAGETLVRASAGRNDPDLDVDNGPKPQSCDITEVLGQRIYRVEFEIVLSVLRCGGQPITVTTYGAAKHPHVLNNRWTVTDTRDKNWWTTRTVEGILRVSHIDYWPHVFRALTVPPLQKGFRRESMRFADSADGLTLRYQIVDRQMHAAPPTPAVDWEATYTETTGVGGAIGFGDMRIKLYGAPDTEQFKLLEAAVEVLFERLGDITKTYDGSGKGEYSHLLQHMAIVEHLHVNEVEISARVQHSSRDQRILNARFEKFGDPLGLTGYDKKKWPVPKLYDGKSPSGMFAKFLQSACTDSHGITQPQTIDPVALDTGSDDRDQGQAQFFDDPEPMQQDDDTGVSQLQRFGGFPYTHYEIETRYTHCGGYAQLPIARWNTSTPTAQSARLIPLHRPVTQRVTVVHAERVGDWPQLPEPHATKDDPNGISMALQEFTPLFESPEILPDGKSRLFKGQARYVYLMERAPTAAELYTSGSDPREQGYPAQNLVSGDKQFLDGILE